MRTCFITIKPMKWLKDLLQEHMPDAHTLYSGTVFDTDFQSLRIRIHEDGKPYLFGNPIKDPVDMHDLDESIPKGRYIHSDWELSDKNAVKSDYDKIIALLEAGDFTSYLAIWAYIRCLGWDFDNIYCLPYQQSNQVGSLLRNFETKSKDLRLFLEVYAERFAHAQAEQFKSQFPITRNFWYLSTESTMTNKEFAEYFGTSIRNVENWRAHPESLADYIYDLFEYKLLKEGII